MDISLIAGRRRASVIVRAFGPGVPADSLSLLFEPCFRDEADRGRGSVGFGPAIARRADAIHGGRITA